MAAMEWEVVPQAVLLATAEWEPVPQVVLLEGCAVKETAEKAVVYAEEVPAVRWCEVQTAVRLPCHRRRAPPSPTTR